MRISVLAIFLATSAAHAQRPAECDSTVLVDVGLTQEMDVREKLADWLPANAGVRLLFQRPELTNKNWVMRNLIRSYPPKLRNQGIGGETRFALLIDTTGTVRGQRIIKPAILREFDDAAEGVVRDMRFEPPRLESGCAVRALLRVPVVFAVR